MDLDSNTLPRYNVFCAKFWRDFVKDPKELIDTLGERKKYILYAIFNPIIFCRVIFSEYGLNHCLTRGSSLAFAMLLTLIPLITTSAFMLTSFMDVKATQVERVISLFLPFAPPEVLGYISTFFLNAQKLKGLGIGVLIIVTVGLFGTVEESLNTIWKVNRSRSFFTRLRAFTMVMVYSPILFFASFQFRSSVWLDTLTHYFSPFDLLPFVLMILAFTTLIFFVPNTKVRFRSAFIGGMIAALLFEFERRTFGTYVQFSIQTQTIYGAFGILPLFLVSLFFVSLFFLFGAQTAYVYQNYRPLLRSKKRWDRRVGDYRTYITLRIMIDSVSAFIRKKRPPTLYYFARKYELTEAQANGILKWLTHEGFLHNVNSKDEYVPARDYTAVPIKEILDAIENQNRRIPSIPSDFTREYIAELITSLTDKNDRRFDTLTFEQLVFDLSKGESRSSKVAATV